MTSLQFCSELDKVRPQMYACWPWQNAIDRFVSTLGKIRDIDSTHLS